MKTAYKGRMAKVHGYLSRSRIAIPAILVLLSFALGLTWLVRDQLLQGCSDFALDLMPSSPPQIGLGYPRPKWDGKSSAQVIEELGKPDISSEGVGGSGGFLMYSRNHLFFNINHGVVVHAYDRTKADEKMFQVSYKRGKHLSSWDGKPSSEVIKEFGNPVGALPYYERDNKYWLWMYQDNLVFHVRDVDGKVVAAYDRSGIYSTNNPGTK